MFVRAGIQYSCSSLEIKVLQAWKNPTATTQLLELFFTFEE
jgi:hypothetical protein